MLGSGYLAGGVAAVVAGLALWVWIERDGKADALAAVSRLEAEASQLKASLAAANRNVERMLEQADADNRIVAEVLRDKQAIAADLVDLRTQLQEIEANDDASRDYLRSPVPDSVRGLANRRPADRNAGPLPGASGGAPGGAP